MSTTGQPSAPLKAVKTKLRLKKSDVRQCRLCLRVLPRACIRETRTNDNLELRQKIWDAVAVRLASTDRVSTVCTNCIRLVDIVTGIRMSCRQADTIHGLKPMMLHPGSWMEDKNQKVLGDCLALVDRNRAEMAGLIRISGLGEVKPPLREMEKVFLKQEEDVMETEKDPEAKIKDEDETTPVSDLVPKEENPEEQIPEKMEIPSLEVLLNLTPEKVLDPPTQEVLDEILGPPTQQLPEEILGSPTQEVPEDPIVENDVELVSDSDEPPNTNEASNKDEISRRKYPMCDICGRWITHHDRERHMNMHHRKVKPYPCTVEGCTVHCYSQKTRRAHIRQMHSERGLKETECHLCHKKLKEKALKGHMHKVHSTAGKKACPVCGKLFLAQYLKDHMAVHTNERSYECEQCGQKFNAKTNWITHRKKHLSVKIPSVE